MPEVQGDIIKKLPWVIRRGRNAKEKIDSEQLFIDNFIEKIVMYTVIYINF